MNRVYRLVFNRALGVPQVASELACRHGTGTAARGASVRRARLASLVALSLAGLAGPAAATAAGASAGASMRMSTMGAIASHSQSTMRRANGVRYGDQTVRNCSPR